MKSALFRFPAREAVVVGVSAAATQFGAAFAYRVVPSEVDFAIFRVTEQRFLNGLPMYSGDSVDFTPPIFHVLLWPFAHLDPRLGFIIWTIGSTLLAWLVVRMAMRAVPRAHYHGWIIAACVVNAAGVQATLRLGQVSWIVAFLITMAWIAARSSRWVAAGWWTGLAIAFKPFLLVALPVFLVRRQWKLVAVCVLTIAVCCGVSAAAYGWPAFAGWFAALQTTPGPVYTTHFLNASWMALITRMGLPYTAGVLLGLVTILVMVWRIRAADEDASWLLMLLAALLASPLGWIYYQPMLLGPGLALAMSGGHPRLWWLLPVCVVPPIGSRFLQDGSTLIALTAGSAYFWGLLAAFLLVNMTTRPRFVQTGCSAA